MPNARRLFLSSAKIQQGIFGDKCCFWLWLMESYKNVAIWTEWEGHGFESLPHLFESVGL